MGILSFSKNQFHFAPLITLSSSRDERACAIFQTNNLAEKAGLKYNAETFRWVTRVAAKAVKLRQFADESAERKFKNYFITRFKLPEQIIYPDHLTPKSFQIESAQHCLTRSPAYCADEAGLGKTITSILCMNTVPGDTLIICPAHLKYNWASELTHWCIETPDYEIIESGTDDVEKFDAEILILPDSLLTNSRIKSILSERKFTWLFVDEAHRYKEATTQRTQSLVGREDDRDWFAIASVAERIVFLSGTPIPNGRPIELYPLLSAIAPHAIGHRPLIEYGKIFCAGKQVTRFEGKRAIPNWDFKGCSNLKLLRKDLRAEFMVRHLKKNVLKELGPKTRQIIFLEDSQNHLAPYERAVLKNHTLEQLMGEDHELGDIAAYRRAVGNAKINQAFSIINQHLENTNEKVVVFAHHINVVEGLTRLLSDHHPLMIRGGMTSKKKTEAVRLFQHEKKHRVIVGNLDAMGTGNTLTKAPSLFMVEYDWRPGTNEQAEDRIYRMTQKQNVYIRYLVVRNSLDERVLRLVLEKEENIQKVMS